jgi:hypothetical protein
VQQARLTDEVGFLLREAYRDRQASTERPNSVRMPASGWLVLFDGSHERPQHAVHHALSVLRIARAIGAAGQTTA